MICFLLSILQSLKWIYFKYKDPALNELKWIYFRYKDPALNELKWIYFKYKDPALNELKWTHFKDKDPASSDSTEAGPMYSIKPPSTKSSIWRPILLSTWQQAPPHVLFCDPDNITVC